LATLDHLETAGTHRVYGGAYRLLAAGLSEDLPLAHITPEVPRPTRRAHIGES
jgi:hypothetical protein